MLVIVNGLISLSDALLMLKVIVFQPEGTLAGLPTCFGDSNVGKDGGG